MSGIKISQLPVLTNANVHAGDSIPIVDSAAGETKAITMGQLDLRYQGVPNGGTTQQVLAKASGTNKDVYWKSLSKNDVGLGLVDNTSDASKPISIATQAALNLKANSSALATKADTSFVNAQLATKQDQLPSGADGEVLTLAGGLPVWAPSAGGTGSVTSVFGRTGSVTAQIGDYDKTMIGLDQVDNTSDIDKPISTLTQLALNSKEPSLPSGTDGQVLSLVGGAPAWINSPTSVPNGGTTGQALVKASNSNGDVTWANMTTPFTKAAFGTMGLPCNVSPIAGINAASSFMSTTADMQTVIAKCTFITGITAIAVDPQIQAHTVLGARMLIIGGSDTDVFELNDGSGLSLKSKWQSYLRSTLELVWDGVVWTECNRS